MSNLTKRSSIYRKVEEQTPPKLVDLSSLQSGSNQFDVIKDIIINALEVTDCYVFESVNDTLVSLEDSSWFYSLAEPHPLVSAFVEKENTLIENLSDLLQMNRDDRFKSNYDLRKYDLIGLIDEGYLLIAMRPKRPLSRFQKKFISHFSDFISLKNSSTKDPTIDYLESVSELILNTISKKDSYTGGHTKRVGMFAEMICRELNLDEKKRKEVMVGAMIHDIGKIGIPDHILKKNAPLTEDEFEVMKQHPTIGGEILKKIPGFENISKGVCFHHERPDGKGYPNGLKGEEIPLIAKIISLSDAFDAMISTRPYRKAIPPEEAFDILKKFSGTQFDAVIFSAFERAFLNSNISKRYRELKKVG